MIVNVSTVKQREREVLKVDELFKTLINGDLTACVVNELKRNPLI